MSGKRFGARTTPLGYRVIHLCYDFMLHILFSRPFTYSLIRCRSKDTFTIENTCGPSHT